MVAYLRYGTPRRAMVRGGNVVNNKTTTNYVIHGAGGIGCVVAARLADTGRRVSLIARGDHLLALQQNGLQVHGDTNGKWELPAASHARDLVIDENTVILLTMKTDDTFEAVEQHQEIYRNLPIICFQNGVTNEAWLAERNFRTYGCTVMVGAGITQPGVVRHSGGKILEIGAWPSGVDDLCLKIARDLQLSGMEADVDKNIENGKWGKLVRNLSNAYLALTDLSVQEASCIQKDRFFIADVNEEAANVTEAAGLSVRSIGKRSLREQIDHLRTDGVWPARPSVTKATRSYPSTWQDLKAKRGSVEVDHFNGAIVRLGEIHGVNTPFNRILRDLCIDAAARLLDPGTETCESLRSAATQATKGARGGT